MKILVFSDSHGDVVTMERVSLEICPELIIHLGDHAADAEKLQRRVAPVPVNYVRGNCDFGSRCAEQQIITPDGHRLLITHGHRYEVKRSLDSLLLAARLQEAQAVLFGHTHRPLNTFFGAIRAINPGSIGYGGGYAVIETTGESLTCALHTIS